MFAYGITQKRVYYKKKKKKKKSFLLASVLLHPSFFLEALTHFLCISFQRYYVYKFVYIHVFTNLHIFIIRYMRICIYLICILYTVYKLPFIYSRVDILCILHFGSYLQGAPLMSFYQQFRKVPTCHILWVLCVTEASGPFKLSWSLGLPQNTFFTWFPGHHIVLVFFLLCWFIFFSVSWWSHLTSLTS